MGLGSFKRYQDLCKRNYFPSRIGFGPKVTDAKEKDGRVRGGDINRLNSRVRLAKDFQAMALDGYSEEATLGYNGYLQVFLTHSALERFMEIYGIRKSDYDALSPLMAPYGPERIVEDFFARDNESKLYDALLEKIDSARLKDGFSKCKSGESANVARISAAIRNIFAHGHLTAHAKGVDPKKVNGACMLVSDFLLRFMDAEFTKTIDACYDRIAAKEAPRGLEPATSGPKGGEGT